MPLEDHAGDILAKARKAAGMPVERAAALAGRSPAELEAFEESGVGDPACWLPLASSLSLDPVKYSRVAQGWVPSGIELSAWRELRQVTTTQKYPVHCYLVWDEATREAALFDTGWDASPALEIMEREGLTLLHLFLTHTHQDHIAGLRMVRERHPGARLHSSSKSAPVAQRNKPQDFIQVGNLRVSNRETPGHSEDSVAYLVGNFPDDQPGVAIVGDAIFAGSVGTGFQSPELGLQSVRQQILSLPGETLLCPGHGPVTTVGLERGNNPFF